MPFFNRHRPAGAEPANPLVTEILALGTSTEAQNAELRSRLDAVARIVRAAITAQGDLHAEDRNADLIDLALDVLTALGRTQVPVTPGRPR